MKQLILAFFALFMISSASAYEYLYIEDFNVNSNQTVSYTHLDVTALVDYLLSHDATNIDLEAANCNQDQDVDIADVTTLVDYLLSHNW